MLSQMDSFYEQYLRSSEWRDRRDAVLSRDLHQCQTCLTTEALEVHHKTYERLGDEALEDLITLCDGCHHAITDVIRRRRYSGKTISLSDHQALFITPKERAENVSKIEVQDCGRVSSYSPQRPNQRSDESIFQRHQSDQLQARQDGR